VVVELAVWVELLVDSGGGSGGHGVGHGGGWGGGVGDEEGREVGGQGGREGGGGVVLIFDSLFISLHFSLPIILTINVRLSRTSTLSLFDCNYRHNSTPIDYSSVLVCCYKMAIAS
jgi:hypothetical protein